MLSELLEDVSDTAGFCRHRTFLSGEPYEYLSGKRRHYPKIHFLLDSIVEMRYQQRDRSIGLIPRFPGSLAGKTRSVKW